MKKEIGKFEVVNEEALDEICAGIESLSFGDVGKFTLLDTSGRQIMVEATKKVNMERFSEEEMDKEALEDGYGDMYDLSVFGVNEDDSLIFLEDEKDVLITELYQEIQEIAGIEPVLEEEESYALKSPGYQGKINVPDSMKTTTSVSLMAIWDKYDPEQRESDELTLEYGTLRRTKEGDETYYDLILNDGRVACMDGETCEILEETAHYVILQEVNEKTPFKLSQEEFKEACYMYENVKDRLAEPEEDEIERD